MKSKKVRKGSSKDRNTSKISAPIESDEVKEQKGPSIFEDERLVITLILISTAFVFFNSLNNQFVYDDWFQIQRNPSLLSWENVPTLLTSSVWQFMEAEQSRPVGPYFRPVFSFSLLLNYQLFGFGVVGWHLFSVFWHLATTLLVYRLGQIWSGSKEISVVAALLFALHPVHTEAVAWASASTEVLLGFFTIACLVCYELSKAKGRFRWLWFGLSIISALLAMGSKETGIMIPLFLFFREGIEYFLSEKPQVIKEKLLRVSPFVLCSVSYLLARYSVLGFINQTHPLAERISTWEWILTAPYILIEYVRLMVFPYPLAFVYDYRFINSITNPKFLASVALIAGLSVLIYRFGRKSFLILSSIGVFLIFLLPALNLKGFSPFESLLHDRYLYLPSVGFCLILAVLLKHGAEKIGGRTQTSLTPLTIAVFIVCVILGALTALQNRTWQNDFTLTENALKHAPDWAFLHTHYGELNAEIGNFEAAERSLNRALEIGENPAGTYKSLGYVFLKQGRFAEAETSLKKAIELGQSSMSSWNNLGIALFESNKINEAESVFGISLQLSSENPLAFYYLGRIHEIKGKRESAEKAFRSSLNVDADFVDARLALANLLASDNRTPEALDQIEFVKQKNPGAPNLLLTLGSVYLHSKRCQEAVDVLNQWVEKEPQAFRAHLLLGFGYECLDDREMAKKSFEEVIKLSPNTSASETARRRLETVGGK